MTSVCVILNKNCHPEKTKKQAVKRRSFCFVQDLSKVINKRADMMFQGLLLKYF